MAHWADLYPARFLQGKAVTEPRTIKIVKLAPPGDLLAEGEKPKGILTATWVDPLAPPPAKGQAPVTITGEIVWCKTNAALTEHAIGIGSHLDWPGHYVTIHFDPTVRFGAETPGGIRVCGSPELRAAKTVEIKSGSGKHRRTSTHRLTPTGIDGREKGSKPAPERDPITQEVVPS